jgi:hypothetical protein
MALTPESQPARGSASLGPEDPEELVAAGSKKGESACSPLPHIQPQEELTPVSDLTEEDEQHSTSGTDKSPTLLYQSTAPQFRRYIGTVHDQPQTSGGGTITGYKSGEHSVGKMISALPYINSLQGLLTIISQLATSIILCLKLQTGP